MLLFGIGSLLFWLLVGVISFLMIVAIEYERAGWATLSLVTTFGVLGVFGDFNVLQAFKAHPGLGIGLLVGYFIIGTIWSIIKWWFFVIDAKGKYNTKKLSYLAGKNIKDGIIPAELKSDFYMRCGYSTFYRPKAADSKSRILTWMTFWPWSMIWTIINDPVRKLFKMIYNKIQHIFEAISKDIWKDIDES